MTMIMVRIGITPSFPSLIQPVACFFSVTIHDTSFLCVSTRRHVLPCVSATCRCPSPCHFSKCIRVVIDSWFMTLKLEFTNFSILFLSALKRLGWGKSEELCLSLGSPVTSYRQIKTTSGVEERAVGHATLPWLPRTTSSSVLTHTLYMQRFHCTFTWCHFCSQQSITEPHSEKEARNTLSAEAQCVNLQRYWRTEHRQLNMIGLRCSGWKSLSYYNPNQLQQ